MGTGRHQIAHFLDPHHNADTFDSALFWTPAGFLSQYYDVITLRWQRAWGRTLGLDPYLINELPHANNSPAMITRSLLPTMGPGGPQSCISNLRNHNITVTIFTNFHLYFKQAHTRVLLVIFLMSQSFMSHVGFKKRLCRPVKLKGLEP